MSGRKPGELGTSPDAVASMGLAQLLREQNQILHGIDAKLGAIFDVMASDLGEKAQRRAVPPLAPDGTCPMCQGPKVIADEQDDCVRTCTTCHHVWRAFSISDPEHVKEYVFSLVNPDIYEIVEVGPLADLDNPVKRSEGMLVEIWGGQCAIIRRRGK